MRFLRDFPGRIERAMLEGLKDCAYLVERAAKENIAYGRSDWPRLKKSTILARIRKTQKGRETLARVRTLREIGASVHYRASVIRRELGYRPFRPLLDTGTLMRSIKSEVEGHRAIVGSSLEYAPVHEFGTTRAGRRRNVRIPARPYLRPAAEENVEEMRELFVRRLRHVCNR